MFRVLKPSAPVRPAVAAVVFCLGLGALATWMLNTPPRVVERTADAANFSGARAFEHVAAMAQRPHRMGTLENVRVREYLLEAFRAAGYEAQVQQDPVLQGGDRWSVPQNVWAYLPGTDPSGTVLITAHYDSVPYGPGAADDVTGVSAMLETARALKTAGPLRNNVLFVATDGEEVNLLGAKAVVESHPHRDEIRMVLNFEARGVGGPSMMFHTGPNAGTLIRGLMAAAPYPVASSFMFDVASRMPTTTDYWVFKKAGLPGLDFAFVKGLPYYHTVNDSPEKLDQRSLQHHGSSMLALARYFGEAELNDLEAPDLVYFNTFGHHMVAYGTGWIWPVTAAVVLLYLLTLVLGLVRRDFSIAGVLLGGAVFLFTALIVPIVLCGPLYLGFQQFGPYALYNQPAYEIGFALLTLAIAGYAFSLAARAAHPGSLFMGAVAWLVLLLVAMTAYLPLGSYLLAWPLAGALLAALVLVLLPQESPWALRFGVLLAGAAPALVLISPALAAFYDTVSIVAGPVIMMGFVLQLGLLLPLVCVAFRPWPRLAPLALALVALPFLGMAIYNTSFSADRPKMFHLAYGMTPGEQTACWISKAEGLDEWTAQFFANSEAGTFAEYDLNNAREYRRAPAPVVAVDEPQIEVLQDIVTARGRELSVKLRPGAEAAEFQLFAPPEVEVRDARINGRPFGKPQDGLASWRVRYQGRADEGVRFDFVFAPGQTPVLHLVELYYDLLGLKSEQYTPQPDWMIVEPNTMPDWDFSREKLESGDFLRFNSGLRSNHSFVRYRYEFPANTAAK